MDVKHESSSLPEMHRTVPIPAAGSWFRRLFSFAGPAYLVSVGYMDPGNWATDLAGGARFGYQLMWVLLLRDNRRKGPKWLSSKTTDLSSQRDLRSISLGQRISSRSLM